MKLIIALAVLFSMSTEAAFSGVQTDAKTFKEIYEANLKQSQIDILAAREKYNMEASYSINKPSGSQFSNDYYEIPYTDQVAALSTFGFYGGYELFQSEKYLVNPLIGFGYTFEESIISAQSKNGGIYKDVIKFQSIPIFLGTKLAYKVARWNVSSVYTRLGFNYEWVSIVGSLDGINQSYWSPGYTAHLGTTLFESSKNDMSAWFGGISLSAGIAKPFLDNKKGSKSNLLEIGMIFLL